VKIGVLLGDDIGHEVVPECVKVMKAAAARTGLRDAALRVHRRLAECVLEHPSRGSAPARVTAWIESGGKDLAHWQRTVAEMRAAEAADFATLTVGVEALRKIAGT